MTQAEARAILEKTLRAFQRYRSIINEINEDEMEAFANVWPWVFGDKCPIPAIAKVLDREKIVPMDLYNIMFILSRFTPEVKAAGEMEHKFRDVDFEFPEPDTRWLVEGFGD